MFAEVKWRAFLLLSICAPGHASDYCTCLNESAPSSGARDGGYAYSIVIPNGAAASHPFSPDTEARVWKGDGWVIAASYYQAHETSEGQACAVNGRSIFLGLSRKTELRVFLPDPDRPKSVLGLFVSASSHEAVCRIGATVLKSLAFVNVTENLTLEEIASDKSSFKYRNELGELRVAKIGDIITRDNGKVIEITESSVSLVDLVENDSGGWNEQLKQLTLAGKAR